MFKIAPNTNQTVKRLEKGITECKNRLQTEIKEIVFRHIPNKENQAQKDFTELVTAKLNPDNRGTIYKKEYNPLTGKVEKIPYEVYIAESANEWQTTYHFMDKNMQDELGYVIINDWAKAEKHTNMFRYYGDANLLNDYPKEGIIGDRITIDFLQNNCEDKFSGIANLGEQAAIEYCKKNNIKPNIVDMADYNSHAAHYMRGRRYFTKPGQPDPNKIIAERIAKTPKGQKVNTRDLGELYLYMPQNQIISYLETIEKNPIFY